MKIEGVVKILEYYTAYGMILDKQGILNIVSVFLNENNLYGILNDLMFVDLSHCRCVGLYEKNSKTIYLDLRALYNKKINKYCQSEVNLPVFQSINQQIIISVFHELGHAIFLSIPDFTPIVSRNVINYILGIIKNENMFDKNMHDYFPYEKEANTFAYGICLSLYQSINKCFIDDESLRRLYVITLEMFLKGYDGGYDNPLWKVISTFSSFNLVSNNYHLMQQDIVSSNLDLYERLKYGFPITYDEETYLRGILNYYKFYPLNSTSNIDIKKLILNK